MLRSIYLTASVLLFTFALFASESRVGMAFWDVDGLYDTIPSLFYDDSDYTPDGQRGWSTQRYMCKIESVAAVVDSMKLPIVMLYGVENESVVRDIVLSTKEDYAYIHATRNSLDGLDFALLYFGDILFVDKVDSYRDMLVIEGELLGESITIIGVTSAHILADYEVYSDGARVVVMGRYTSSDIEGLPLVSLFERSERRGYGNYCNSRGWTLRHRAAVGGGVEPLTDGIYIKEWLLLPDRSAPFATFSGRRYQGGYSSYLPIFIYFR